jgi:hypothetical protein
MAMSRALPYADRANAPADRRTLLGMRVRDRFSLSSVCRLWTVVRVGRSGAVREQMIVDGLWERLAPMLLAARHGR